MEKSVPFEPVKLKGFSYPTLGSKIKALMALYRVSCEDLAKILDVKPSAVHRWCLDYSVPKLPVLNKIAKVFDVPLDFFS